MEDFTLYKSWLELTRGSESTQDSQAVVQDFLATLDQNTAYQPNATRNGSLNPIVAIRKNSNVCDITVIPGSELFIGDLVGVYGETWLVVELWQDEYEMTYGTLWMCNQIFRFQNGTSDIIEKYAVLDDGSYSKNGDKTVNVVDSNLTCYMSYDDESKYLYVDKRMAISRLYGANKNEILEAGKISYIDTKAKNYGEGSHLLKFRLDDDVYSEEKDSLDEMICDYIYPDNADKEEGTAYLVINGRDSIKLGTGRNYTVSGVTANGESVEVTENLEWSLIGNTSDNVTITIENNVCTLTVGLDETLYNTVITLQCTDTSGQYNSAIKQVEVQ